MDPAIIRAQDAHTRVTMERIITQYTWTRQDTWRDRNSARKSIDSQAGSRYWHSKVKDAYVVRSAFLYSPLVLYSVLSRRRAFVYTQLLSFLIRLILMVLP